MAQGRKATKCSTRKKNTSLRNFINRSDSDSEYFDLDIRNKSSKKRKKLQRIKTKKHLDYSRDNILIVRKKKVLSKPSKPVSLVKTSHRNSSVEKRPRISSVFNDSFSFEESPFSKLTKNIRQDQGLKFANICDYLSPRSLIRDKLQSSSSGCLISSGGLSGHLLSPDECVVPSENLSQKNDSNCSNESQEAHLPNDQVAKNILGQNCYPASSTDGSNNCIFPIRDDEQNKDASRASIDFVEGTPPLPLPPRIWNKSFKKRRRALLITSTPLCNSALLTSSQNISSPFLPIQNSRADLSNNSSKASRSTTDSIPSPQQDVLHACNQRHVMNFLDFIQQRDPVTLEKVGEGVFSEVYGCLDKLGIRSVWKVQPFEGDIVVNGEPQKKSAEMLSELCITNSLSELRAGNNFMTYGFVETLGFKCVHGPYPEILLKLWHKYDDEKGSENDCPDIFPEQQLLLLTELEYAGLCMEDFQFSSSSQALSVFSQVAHTLAVGEMSFEFEHRDLHWGNIMICRTPDKYVSFVISGERRMMETKGVLAKVVDFSLSRASVNGKTLFTDLSLTPEIFESTGEYQFDVYRLMRDHTGNEWSNFTPYTNVLWLHYVVFQMCNAVKYRNKKSKIHKNDMKKLKSILSSILKCTSASEFVANQDFYPYTTDLVTN